MTKKLIGTPPHDINVRIEIPLNSKLKYEFNEDHEEIFLDRVMYTAMNYPVNYGAIPDTKAADGDEVDVLLITDYPIQAGVYVRSRPIGVLIMEDEDGMDEKIICVPHSKVDKRYESWKEIGHIPVELKDKINHFFEHYKDLEKDKFVKISGWKELDSAQKLIMDQLAA